ncbi:hypothetical protein [Aureimonas sp. AU4]|uniref:hypothetical protein n=1 Tax=Aureimonas sp. AU4 TaxID=1638163 RepID=UPI000784301A|nr:hypothetical protein [Aureimonas sp. AU4]
MVQRVRDYAEGLMRGLGITVKCRECGKQCTFLASDFHGYIDPRAVIEDMTWRCTWCRTPSTWIRWVVLDRITREGLTQWKPPAWLKRRF